MGGVDGEHPRRLWTVRGSGRPLLLLHGWGVSSELFDPILDGLQPGRQLIVPDLPGFGATPEPDAPWSVHEYADWCVALLDRLGVETLRPRRPLQRRPDRDRHRGRASADGSQDGARRERGDPPAAHARSAARVRTYKALRARRAILSAPRALRRSAGRRADLRGSADYRAVTGTMRGTLVRIVNEDLRGLLRDVRIPVLLIWGDHDTETPIDDGRLMEALIPDAGLVVFEGAGHYAYLEQAGRFCRIVEVFLHDPPEGGALMNPLLGPLVAVAAIVWLMLVARIILVAARMFQIEEYESIRFLRWGLTREWIAHRAVWLGLGGRGRRALRRGSAPCGARHRDRVAWLASGAAAQLTWRWTRRSDRS